MPRQPIVRITATFEIAYDRKEFGATGKAEAAAEAVQESLAAVATAAGAKLTAFVPVHTTREA